MRQPSPSHLPDPALGRGSRREMPGCSVRAMFLWPGLDRSRLVRTHGDPVRIARLVARRTSLAEEVIALLLKETRLD